MNMHKIEIEHENSFIEVLKNEINLFLGAGFSVNSYDSNGNCLPLASELKEELMRIFDADKYEELSLDKLYTIINGTRKTELKEYLKHRFTVDKYDVVYDTIKKMTIRNIFTTNIDNLIWEIYRNSDDYYLNDISINGPQNANRFAIDYMPLHGCVLHKDSEYVFSTLDVASAYPYDSDKWYYLTGQLQRLPTLFWGYSVNDAAVLQALNPKTIKNRQHKEKWIVVTNGNDAQYEYLKMLDFFIIKADTKQLLEYIADIDKSTVASEVSKIQYKKIFVNEIIPDFNSVPVRPLADFYIGHEPTWSDIYSGGLYKTSHYEKIVDSINSGKSTVIVGVPACGKTTLMMQVAGSINFKGIKLFCQLLTNEKAEFIVRNIKNEKTLIFIDNFSDNVDAYNILDSVSNIRLVVADRDYKFDNVSHRLGKEAYNIFDVSDLDERDIQNIFERIPREVRRSMLNKPFIERGVSPSIFEIVESNILRPNIKNRFIKMLQQLKDDEILHDLFIFICYVHSCRTPVSFDMVYAFLRNHIDDYEDVYDFIDSLGGIILDYTGFLMDSNQDHYVPRSIIVSETILDVVTADDLKRVLLRFHGFVSPIRICNYNIFKRSAFDAEIIGKAFWDYNEGKQFYEDMYARDNSPYLLQQGALYLSSKNKHKEAFNWIDKADTMFRGRSIAIKNTYAIILFRANIRADKNNEIVVKTLRESMKILSDCYTKDKRKIYHAIVYADHAIKYWRMYADEESRGYINKAKKWLEYQRENAPWNRKVRNLYRQIEDIMLNL